MTPARRTVVVGERLLPGYTIDGAMWLVLSLGGESVLSVAVLDRPDGTTVLAVTVFPGAVGRDVIQDRLVSDLHAVFVSVSVLESDSSAIEMGESLT